MTGVADRLDETARTRQVLAIVADLAAERHAREAPVVVTPDLSLERDLGLFSLERVELAARLEAATGLAFGEAALADACTVGELIQIAAGHTPTRRARPVAVGRPPAPAAGGPDASMAFTIRVAVVLAGISIGLRLYLLTRPGVAASRRALRWGARMLLKAAGAVPAVRGLDYLDGQLPALLVANHQSYADTAVLLAALPVDGLLIANERLLGAPLIGAAIEAAGYLVVDRTTTSGRARGASGMAEALGHRQTLLVFPEGTIPEGSALGEFRLGAFAAAVRTGRPVIPVTVRGTRQVLPLRRWTLARAPLSVTVHPPIVPRGSGWGAIVQMARLARTAMESGVAPVERSALGIHGRGEPDQRP